MESRLMVLQTHIHTETKIKVRSLSDVERYFNILIIFPDIFCILLTEKSKVKQFCDAVRLLIEKGSSST